MEGAPHEFFVTDNSHEKKLIGKAVYFVKVDASKPVNKSAGSDNDVLFGEISENSITSLALIFNHVYKPYIERIEADQWGVCEDDQRKEFLSGLTKFSKELKDAMVSLKGLITLDKYDS